MKQMNKEELIEFFIQQLGDNDIIGRVMSIDQISDKLNSSIHDVIYDDTLDTPGAWYFTSGVISFNFSLLKTDDEVINIVVHEMLHALTSYHETYKIGPYSENNYKTGLHLSFDYGHTFVESCRAIDEGMTQFYTNKITGINVNSYKDEQEVYKVLSVIIGEEELFREYLSDNVDIEYYDYYSPFRDIFKTKYGEKLGEDLDKDFIRVIQLSDLMLNFRRNKNKKDNDKDVNYVETKTKEELIDLLESMLSKVLEYNLDVLDQILDLIPLFDKIKSEKFYESVLSKLLDSDVYSADEKLSIISSLNEDIIIPSSIKDRIMEESDFSIDQRVELCPELFNSLKGIDKLFNYCVNAGLIRDAVVPKKEMFNDLVDFLRGESITESLKEVRYKKVSNYYEMTSEQYNFEDILLYDENGNPVTLRHMTVTDNNGTDMFYNRYCESQFHTVLNNDSIDELHERIYEHNSRYLNDLKENACDINNYELDVHFNEKIMIVSYTYYGEDELSERTFKEYYIITEDGSLEAVKPRSRKKIYR